MIPAQRKRHRIIWLVFAILLPILFVLTVLVIPKPVTQPELYQESPLQLNSNTNLQNQ